MSEYSRLPAKGEAMNRRNVLQGLAAIFGIGQYPPLICTEKGNEIQCRAPEPLNEGEERCPLGHAQRPNTYFLLGDRSPLSKDGKFLKLEESLGELIVHCCAVCGTIYVQQAQQKSSCK